MNMPPTRLPPAAAPGPDLGTLLRSLPGLRANPLQFLQDAANRYGDVTRFQIGGLGAFLVNHPEAIQRVLQDNARNYSKDTFQYNSLATVTGRGLLTSDGEFWLRQRRLVQPAFHRQRIAGFGPLITSAAGRLVQSWEISGMGWVDVDQAMMRLALEILGKALLGVDLSGEAPALTAAVLTVLDHVVGQVKSPPGAPGFIPTSQNRRFRAAMHTLDQAVADIVENHRRSGSPQGDLLSLLMQAGEGGNSAMDSRQLRDELVTILIAGHETVASALTWCCYLLAQNPDCEQELRAELDRVLDRRPPTAEDLPALDYTRRVFDEALRLYPPAWIITRRALGEDQLCGYSIPRGSLVVIGVSAIHRHPAYWPDPQRFDPDRFSAQAAESRLRFAYLPFGGGPRLCIGNHFALVEGPLILATVYQRVHLELPEAFQVTVDPLVTLRPHGGLPMRVVPWK
jgi:cytochrome P450